MVSSKGRKALQLQWRVGTALLVFFVFSCLASSSAFAACHTVSPSGSGSKNGADWNNAFAGIPGTLVRGDIYYLADGTYPGYTITQGTSGTSTIEFRKAQSFDNCTSTGWSTSTMGSGQAIFTGSTYIETSYLIFNGNGTLTAPGCGGAFGSSIGVTSGVPTPTDCGISLNNLGGSNSLMLYIQSGTNLTFKYVEVVGNGNNTSDQHEIFGPISGDTNNSFKHLYLHYAGCVFMQDMGSNTTVDHSYFWGTEVNGGSECHGQAEFEIGGTNNGVRSNNVYRDITGTAIWTFAASVGTNDNWQFYNNIVFWSSPKASWNPGLSDAALDCINGNLCTNFTFVQNTIANCYSGAVFGCEGGVGFADGASGCSAIVENNVWYGNTGGISLTKCSSMTLTEDYNSFLNSGGFTSGSHDVSVSSGATNPFVSWPSASANFSLASDASDWNSRLSLSSPYTVDVSGNTFVTDRGAYQFMASGAPPAPPTGLAASVSP
jgi:hypothetical protein